MRIVGGRAVYEAVSYLDSTPGTQVCLQRIDAVADGLIVVRRYVDPDTQLEPADAQARAAWTHNKQEDS